MYSIIIYGITFGLLVVMLDFSYNYTPKREFVFIILQYS